MEQQELLFTGEYVYWRNQLTKSLSLLNKLEVVYTYPAAAAAKLLQSCPTLCGPIDGSPPGSPVPGFSMQKHWSGLPVPSPMDESEK